MRFALETLHAEVSRREASQFFQSASGLSAVAPSTRQDTDVANDPLGTRLPDSVADPQ